MEIKKVTLVVIVYNVEAFLRQCLDSVVNQTYRELQIIIVDDGSTDGSEKSVMNMDCLTTECRLFIKKTEEYLLPEMQQ